MNYYTRYRYQFFDGIPRVIFSVLVLLLALVIALIAKSIVLKLCKRINLSKWLQERGLAQDAIRSDRMVDGLGRLTFWLVFILFLPNVLESLNMSTISTPLTAMATKFFSYIPNLIGAAIVLVVGNIIAKLIRDLIAVLLRKLKIDELQSKIGISSAKGSSSLSSLLSGIVYILIWIPIIISALEILNIRALSIPAIAMLEMILMIIPRIFAAVILVMVGFYLAKLIGNLVNNLLSAIGIDSLPNKIGLDPNNMPFKYSLSQVITAIVKFIIILLFTVEALTVINLMVLNKVGLAIIAYLPHLISAILTFVVGLFIATWVEGLLNQYTSISKFLTTFIKYAIIIFTVFMTLNQLGIAMTIVNTAFMMLLGALTVAFAISFGIGGRDFAARTLERFEKSIYQGSAGSSSNNTFTSKGGSTANNSSSNAGSSSQNSKVGSNTPKPQTDSINEILEDASSKDAKKDSNSDSKQ